MKLLTVSIAAYNVAPYLRQTLDSCVVPEIMDELEVLIVNDRSMKHLILRTSMRKGIHRHLDCLTRKTAVMVQRLIWALRRLLADTLNY